MKPFIIKRSLIARLLGVGAIVLYPFVLFSEECPADVLVRHEMIHVEQIKKNGAVVFYYSYLLEYFKNRIKGMNHNDAYLAISFEQEAYKNQNKIT